MGMGTSAGRENEGWKGSPPLRRVIGPAPQPLEAGARVLVVEDDAETRRLLARLLRDNGYEASVARDGVEMWEMLERAAPDLVLLDVMLPGQSGLELCRALRAEHAGTAVIMVTAKGDQIDRVRGLDVGADDYLPKPFSRYELLARIRAVLRRIKSPPTAAGGPLPPTREWLFGGWRLETATRELVSPDGVQVGLSHAEFDLLMVFLAFAGRPLSRERLLELTRQRTSVNPASDRSIDMLVSRLRRKLEPRESSPPMIRTSRGVGYVLAVRAEAH
jgi:two-component system OmpR family response regulator